MPWIGEEPLTETQRIATIERFQGSWDDGSEFHYGLFQGDAVVGGLGLHARIGPGALEIGYWIHVDHQGRGYSTRGAQALTEAGLAVPGVRLIEIHHDRANLASRAIPERLGYRFVEEVPGVIVAPGQVGWSCIWRKERPEDRGPPN
jgi:ribosomal-protein-serine acetyltransferase